MKPQRLLYHLEPPRGWMNDPNGLCFFKGKYHVFYQHYPDAPVHGTMYWGHAVTDDFVHWEHLPIALSPDMPYENAGGCFSGSAVVKDGLLYLFYTGDASSGETQAAAVSEDGIRFEKYSGNPVIPVPPEEGSRDFRDPKVSFFDGYYHMVCGTGKDGIGKVVRYTSDDLLHWDYQGVLFEGADYGPVIECPDFFRFGDEYVLYFSRMDRACYSTVFAIGGFDGTKFTPRGIYTPETGPQFYAPQSFEAPDGRRVVIGWLYDWKRRPHPEDDRAGALTIPREFTIKDGKPCLFPVKEAAHLLSGSDPMVEVRKTSVTVGQYLLPLPEGMNHPRVDILRDSRTLEVFLNGGEACYTVWYGR